MKNYYRSLIRCRSVINSLNVIFGFFLAIVNEKNCIGFDDYFKIEKKSVNLRAQNLERLVLTRSRKRLTEKSFFFRVERLVNNAADLLNISINFFTSKFSRQTTIHHLLLDLTRSKYDICVTYTWYLKCRCNFCIA